MSDSAGKAVFISYASQDVEAARRICEALRAAGVEVWFDAEGGLEHGDEWDAKIRRQIKECVLFLPIISANTQARHEGYFRLEWELAAERAMSIASGVVFILPIVIDATREPEALVPDRFRKVQWTRLPAGEVTPEVRARLLKLWSHRAGMLSSEKSSGTPVAGSSTPPNSDPVAVPPRRPTALFAGVAAALVAVAGWWFWRGSVPASPGPKAAPSTVAQGAKAAAPVDSGKSTVAGKSVGRTAKDDKSLVVLPLENLSPDPENAFFTEGIHAEIIATLHRTLPDTRVISRESSLLLKRGSAPLAELAQRVEVAYVLTGSVRRAGERVRIQLELRRAGEETPLWAPTYDRELKDVFAVQSEIAASVAQLLQVRQLAKLDEKWARTTTTNPQAYDAYLKAKQLRPGQNSLPLWRERIELLSAAVKLDPGFVAAQAELTAAYVNTWRLETDSSKRALHAAEAKRWAEQCRQLSPGGIGDAVMAAYLFLIERDYARALVLIQTAVRALPNAYDGHALMGGMLVRLGRMDEAQAAFGRALAIDPLNRDMLVSQLDILARLRRFEEWENLSQRFEKEGGQATNLSYQRYNLTGKLPDGLKNDLLWLRRARRWDDLVRVATTRLQDAKLSDIGRLNAYSNLAFGIRGQGKPVESAVDLPAMLAVIEKVRAADPGDSAQRAVIDALQAAGKTAEALTAARQRVKDIAAEGTIMERWGREVHLARVEARAGNVRESVSLIKKLLAQPSDLTVPQLRAHPDWDNLREDAEFKALLADSKNSAPL